MNSTLFWLMVGTIAATILAAVINVAFPPLLQRWTNRTAKPRPWYWQASLPLFVFLTGAALWWWYVHRDEVRCFRHADEVLCVAFSPDSKYVLSGCKDGLVRLWNVDDGQLVRRFAGHKDAVTCVVFSPDGKRILSCSDDHTVRLWDTDTGNQDGRPLASEEPLNRPEGGAIFLPKDDQHVLIRWYDRLSLVDIDAKKEVGQFRQGWPVVHPDARRFLVSDDPPAFWDLDKEQPPLDLTPEGQMNKLLNDSLAGIEPTTCAALSPDGRFVATGKHSRYSSVHGSPIHVDDVVLWNLETGKEQLRLSGHSDKINGVAFSPSGHYVLSGSDDGTVRLWDVDGGAEQCHYLGHLEWLWGGAVTAVAISPDGSYALSSSRDKTARLWRMPK